MGKSGAFIVSSADKKYFIKSLSCGEVKFMNCNFIDKYIDYILEN